MNFYYFSICHSCKKRGSILKKCSNCRVPYYCSKAHQLLDWPNHKNLCKIITNTNKFHSFSKGCSASEFNEYKYTTSILWKFELGRDLEFYENHMWMFPKVCSVCYSSEADIVCENCLSVVYCSEAHRKLHKENHAKGCDALKLCLIIYQTVCTEQLMTDWVKFKISKEAQVQGANLEDTIKFIGYSSPHDYSKNHVDYVIMSDYFCPAINLIFPLEKSGFIERRQARKPTLIIHVVGTSNTEDRMSWILIVEYLSHWMYNLRNLKIYLIGPEQVKEETATISLKCQDCKKKNFLATLVKIRGLYHDHINCIPKPDLVAAFNSGLHEFEGSKHDTWKKSIPKLIHFKEVPTMLTAYTESELLKDVARFKESSLHFLVSPQRNPFSSLRPNRNWEEDSEPVFYLNGYITIFTKK